LSPPLPTPLSLNDALPLYTPPGLWLITAAEDIPANDRQAAAFGPVYLYLQPVAGEAVAVDRPGIGWHGGGSGLPAPRAPRQGWQDRKSTRLNSSHVKISYA